MAKPAAGVTRTLFESLTAYGTVWPRDALRPQASFGKSIVQAAERALCVDAPTASSSSAAAASQELPSGVDHLTFREPLSASERRNVEQAIDALRFLKDGQASKMHPVPATALAPKSNPIYYSRLADMLIKASKGERVALTFAQRVRIFFGKPA